MPITPATIAQQQQQQQYQYQSPASIEQAPILIDEAIEFPQSISSGPLSFDEIDVNYNDESISNPILDNNNPPGTSDNIKSIVNDNLVGQAGAKVLDNFAAQQQQLLRDQDHLDALRQTNNLEEVLENENAADESQGEHFETEQQHQPKKLKVKLTRTVKTTKVTKLGNKVLGVNSNVQQGSSIKQKDLIGNSGLFSSSSARSLASDEPELENHLDQDSKLPVNATTTTTPTTSASTITITAASTTTKPVDQRVIIGKPNGIFSLVNRPTVIPAAIKSKPNQLKNTESNQDEDVSDDD